MNRYPLWKYAIILVVLVISAIYALPNLFGEAPAVQVSPARATVKVDSATVTRVERALAEQSLTPDVIQLEGTSVRARFASTDDQLKARDAIDRALNPDPATPDHIVALNLVPRTPGWLAALHASPMYLGLDLRGGVHFMLQVDMAAALQRRVDVLTTDLRNALREKNVRHGGVNRNGVDIEVRARDAATLVTAGLLFLAVLCLIAPVLEGAPPALHLAQVAPGLAVAFALGYFFWDGAVAAVAAWFEAPVDFVFDAQNHVHHSGFWQGRTRSYIEIMWQEHRIWGVTAAIIANLAQRLAWLERAHILTQRRPWLHARSHWLMLQAGWQQGDMREVLGQMPRILAALIASTDITRGSQTFFGVPRGVSAFAALGVDLSEDWNETDFHAAQSSDLRGWYGHHPMTPAQLDSHRGPLASLGLDLDAITDLPAPITTPDAASAATGAD